MHKDSHLNAPYLIPHVYREPGNSDSPVALRETEASRNHGLRHKSLRVGSYIRRGQSATDREPIPQRGLGTRFYAMPNFSPVLLRQRGGFTPEYGCHHGQQVCITSII